MYRALYRINQSFANIVTHFGELQELKTLKPETARLYRSLAQELQAEVNRGLAKVIETIESRNLTRLVKARKAARTKKR